MRITGKTVYVLGAGASAHTGAPLLRDFLLMARILFQSHPKLRKREAFERAFKRIDALRASSYHVEFDIDNLEHVFSLAEMSKQILSDGGGEFAEDLKWVLLETLDRCKIRLARKQPVPESVYQQFQNRIRLLNKRRKETALGDQSSFASDAVISFNYDVMLDNAICLHGRDPSGSQWNEPNYVFNQAGPTDQFPFLKLHGSTNWAFCRGELCGPENRSKIQVLPPTPFPVFPGRKAEHHLDMEQDDFAMVTYAMEMSECKFCRRPGGLQPVVIPPTWSKIVNTPDMAKVWSAAVNEVKDAFQIVVIGYSLPQTDTFFQYLLTLGLSENPVLNRIVVINQDGSEELKERYARIFSRGHRQRERLVFMAVPFNEFVEQRMETVGGELKLPPTWIS